MMINHLQEWDIPGYPNVLVHRLETDGQQAHRKAGAWKLISGWRLSEDQTIRRFFHYFDKAMENEAAGKFDAAGFFWESCMQIVGKIKGPQREELLKNVLIKTFTGRANGYFARLVDPEPGYKARLLFFLAKTESAVELLQHDGEEQLAYYRELISFLIFRYDRLQDTKKMLSSTDLANKAFPDDTYFAGRLMDLCFQQGMDEMKDEKNPFVRVNLKQLIDKMETRSFPKSLQIQAYIRLGWLYYYYGIRLAGADNVSASLLAVRKAMVYNPEITGIGEAWNSLIERMKNLKVQVEQVLARVRSTPNMHLTGSGQLMKADADAGFIPVNAFIEKEEPALIEKRKAAYQAYVDAAQANPTTAEPDGSTRFDSFALPPPTALIKHSAEPMVYWLFSPKDSTAKSMVIAGLLLILTMGIFSGAQYLALRQRNMSYAAMNTALQTHDDYRQVLKNALGFLKRPPLFGEDQRKAEVIDVYQRTLATWLMTGAASEMDEMRVYLNNPVTLQIPQPIIDTL
jgi:hypothetical protein